MKRLSRLKLVGILGVTLTALLLLPTASAGGPQDYHFKYTRPNEPYVPNKYSLVDIPVSLAAGTVRTPEFQVTPDWYWIMIQVEKPLPLQQMQCMMGVTTGRHASKNCSSGDPLLRADWTVLCEGHIVTRGSSTTKGDALYKGPYIYKYLGSFPGEQGEKQYSVEVKFTRNGTPLNVAHPHLIVIKRGDE